MPDTVITRVNALGSDQPEHLTFTNCHGQLIGDSDEAAIPDLDLDDDLIKDDDNIEIPGVEPAELPGVDGADMQPNNAPQIVEIEDLDTPEPMTVETVEQ